MCSCRLKCESVSVSCVSRTARPGRAGARVARHVHARLASSLLLRVKAVPTAVGSVAGAVCEATKDNHCTPQLLYLSSFYESQAVFQLGRLRIAIEDRRELRVKTRLLWVIAGGHRLSLSRLARANLSGSSGSSGPWGGGLDLCRPGAGDGRPFVSLPLIAICSSGSVDALTRPVKRRAHGFRRLGWWSLTRWCCRPAILLHPSTVCHVALHDSNPAATLAPANRGCNVKRTAAHSISQQQK